MISNHKLSNLSSNITEIVKTLLLSARGLFWTYKENLVFLV